MYQPSNAFTPPPPPHESGIKLGTILPGSNNQIYSKQNIF